jgi:hypothetical protein
MLIASKFRDVLQNVYPHIQSWFFKLKICFFVRIVAGLFLSTRGAVAEAPATFYRPATILTKKQIFNLKNQLEEK